MCAPTRRALRAYTSYVRGLMLCRSVWYLARRHFQDCLTTRRWQRLVQFDLRPFGVAAKTLRYPLLECRLWDPSRTTDL